MLGPLEIPLAGALLAGVLAYSLSRVMLGVDSKVGAVRVRRLQPPSC